MTELLLNRLALEKLDVVNHKKINRPQQQLPQPILLGDGRMIVSVSPQEGFLHQTYRNSIRWASTSRKQSAF
jgi:hypothetical protein